MKPESAAFMRKVREFLFKGDAVLTEWPDEAGRFAYMAGFHAAHALIFHRQSSIAETRSGVRSTFHLLIKDNSAFDNDLRRFLGQSFNLKMMTDSVTGDEDPVTVEPARGAMRQAHRFVDHVTHDTHAMDLDR